MQRCWYKGQSFVGFFLFYWAQAIIASLKDKALEKAMEYNGCNNKMVFEFVWMKWMTKILMIKKTI